MELFILLNVIFNSILFIIFFVSPIIYKIYTDKSVKKYIGNYYSNDMLSVFKVIGNDENIFAVRVLCFYNIRGKEILFTTKNITLKELKKYTLYKLDDEFASQLDSFFRVQVDNNIDFENLKRVIDFRTNIKSEENFLITDSSFTISKNGLKKQVLKENNSRLDTVD